MLRVLLIIVMLMSGTTGAFAQQTKPKAAVLVADQLFITRDRTLVAQGNVEAFHGNTRIRATSIRYNQNTGALQIEGPIVLSEGDETIILADAAQLDAKLQNGLLTGARLILNQQLQLAAAQINRVEGRYSQLYKTSVTSCHICTDGTPPLWQIRAKRVIHDQVERQLYFDEAQFRIRNVPIFYLPRLRMPDPTLKRATGFLIPSIRSTSELGIGLKIPYFIKIGDHRDLMLTPYLSSKTKTLELRYRQAFARGQIQFDAAITRDDEQADTNRGYLFGVGDFGLNRGYKLHFEIQTTSDTSYLKDYGYSDKDRLTSELTVSRVRRDEFIRSSLFLFESLRDSEDNDTIPTVVLDGEYERRFFPSALGGELRYALQAHSHQRVSDLSIDSDDLDSIVDGRDVARLNGTVNWLRRSTFGNGLVSDLRIGATLNAFDITQDESFSQNHFEIAPHAALTLRYPMVRRGTNGVVQTLEPIVQLGWTGGNRLDIPNEESTRVEFDQGNLLALSRFPRPDRRERHAVAAVGINWARFDPDGWDANLTLGQVQRKDTDDAFSQTSGLSGRVSDFLIAAQVKTEHGISLTGRTLFNEDFKLSKAELRGDWSFTRGRLGGSYVWLGADIDEDRTKDVSEITFDGSYAINQNWSASADWRFDVEDDRAATAGLGLTYNNECVSVDLSVQRSYSTSTSVEPSTNIGFNIGLRGFSASSGTEKYVYSCGK